MRRAIFWVTGRDLLSPLRGLPPPPTQIVGLGQLWECTIVPNGGFVVYPPSAPFFLHRWLQWLVLGFRWRPLWENLK